MLKTTGLHDGSGLLQFSLPRSDLSPTAPRFHPMPPEQIWSRLSFTLHPPLLPSQLMLPKHSSCQPLQTGPPPTHCSYSWSHQPASASPSSALHWAQETQRQANQGPILQEPHLGDNSGRSQLQHSHPACGSHRHVVKSNWVPGSLSSLPDYPVARIK